MILEVIKTKEKCLIYKIYNKLYTEKIKFYDLKTKKRRRT